MPLTGHAKKDYQREYMRDYMRNRRAGTTKDSTISQGITVKTRQVSLRPANISDNQWAYIQFRAKQD